MALTRLEYTTQIEAMAVSSTAASWVGFGGGRGSLSGYSRLNRFRIGTNSLCSVTAVLLADG